MKTGILTALCVLLLAATGAAGIMDDGWAAYQNGNYDKAYDLFSKAFRADPGNADINFALGEAARKKGKLSHAVFAYDRVLMADPDHAKARYGKAEALKALGQTDEARAELAALLDRPLDADLRRAAQQSISDIDGGERELDLQAELFVSMFYDDNINFGPTEAGLIVAAPKDEAVGLEAGVNVFGEYDVGRKGGWTAIGGISLRNTWLDDDSAQETASAKVRAGARRLRQRDLLEISARAEKILYGHDELVDIYGLDGAWLYAKTKDDYLITHASIEHRDFDAWVDPNNQRDSIYLKIGETWKHFFDNRNNRIALGAELFLEDALADYNSNRGLRLKADAQRELPFGVIAYIGGRCRLSDYADPNPVVSPNSRDDERWDLILGAKKQITEHWLLDLRHHYIRNDSNIANYDYERQRTSLTAIFEF